MFVLVSGSPVRPRPLHINLYNFKFELNISPHILPKKNCCNLNRLARGSAWLPSSFFPDSGLYLLNGFDFYFDTVLNGVTLKTSNCVYYPSNLFDNVRKFDNSGIFDNSSPKWEARWPHG